MKKIITDPSFWVPALCAILFVGVLFLLTYCETRNAVNQIENNVNKKFDQLEVKPVYVPKYDSTTQAKLDTIEARREMSHAHVDNLYDGEIQNVLDTLFNR